MATTPTGAQEWSRMWHHHGLNIRLLHASHVQHAYSRHSHDYYVVCVIESGLQSFSHGGATHKTPPGGVILINPGAAHTGEPADRRGFVMRSLYPTSAHLEAVYADLTGRAARLPSFRQVRIDDRYARDRIVGLHRALADNAPAL
ncbi:MAG TPA: AraC family ligand binding domain-containing protein, partial [Roseiflexaceae bacterium]|nr:AraC family ligand binding domain-containing protein [Roseiflexaceae bacterium]